MLDGRVAIISGGLGDIGRAIARALAQAGARVALGDVRPSADASDLLAELRTLGRGTRYDRVDVADADAVEAWIGAVAGDLGVPDLIIPNAAIVALADARTITAASWSEQLRIDLDGCFHLAQGCAKRLLAAKTSGRIVFIGSWAADRPHRHIPAYCVAKAGVRMLMKCLALELADADILVNEVAPGYVDAGLSGRIFAAEPAKRAVAEAVVPVRRLITADEVAHHVLALCDPCDRHRTGTVTLVDGGLSLLTPGN
ncbi:MAG: SDR family oxidoreductase [Planctomycetes bacterium]|nr:SDR family oxidoreductase [Planctomycetota bacterium]